MPRYRRIKVKVWDTQTDTVKNYDSLHLASTALFVTSAALYSSLTTVGHRTFGMVRGRFIVKRMEEKFPSKQEVQDLLLNNTRAYLPVYVDNGQTRVYHESVMSAHRATKVARSIIRTCLKSELSGTPRPINGYRFIAASFN